MQPATGVAASFLARRPSPRPRPGFRPTSVRAAAARLATLPAGEMKPCDGTRIIARVGSEAILESEVIGAGQRMVIEANKDRIPPDAVGGAA